MRPRHACLGKLRLRNSDHNPEPPFNEAEARVPRKTRCSPTTCRDRSASFNEAEARVPRKTVLCANHRQQGRTFNEAEARVPRKTLDARPWVLPTFPFNEAEARVPRKTPRSSSTINPIQSLQ